MTFPWGNFHYNYVTQEDTLDKERLLKNYFASQKQPKVRLEWMGMNFTE